MYHLFRCIPTPCLTSDLPEPEAVLYEGKCRDVMEDAVCGAKVLGERLYLGEDGLGYCGCDSGWVRYKDRCYQEFTPAFCPGKNQILTFEPPRPQQLIHGKEAFQIFSDGLKLNFSCQRNPCGAGSYYPHT